MVRAKATKQTGSAKDGTSKAKKATKDTQLVAMKQKIEDKLQGDGSKPVVDEKSASVDSHVPNRDDYEVVTVQGVPQSWHLMWSDLRKNHNKFYIV